MLQILHDKLKGIFASVILALIIASFAFVGLNQLFFSGNAAGIAARVDDQSIDWGTVTTFADRLALNRGIEMSPQLIEDIRFSLVQTKAVENGFKKAGFTIGDRQVAKALASIPLFQDSAGKFSKQKYLSVLKQYDDYSDAKFRAELAQTLLLSQVDQGIFFSNFYLPFEVRQAIQLLMEERSIGYAVLSQQAFADKITPDLNALQSFYTGRKTQYVRPEQVVLQYVELRANQLSDQISVSPTELKNFYLENQGFYNTPEMRQVRHILFATEGKDPEAQARQKMAAEKVLAQLKSGGNFEELAKKYSDDMETRNNGGDLGWIEKGDLDLAFEEAVFALKIPHEIAPLIKSADGYHIIQLLDQKLAMTQAFEAVQDTVSVQFRQQKAQQLFEEKKEQLAALAFESPESLDKIKQIMNLPILETAPFDRAGQGAEKWTQYPELLQVAFSPAILQDKRNSEVISVSPDRALVVRLKSHTLPEQQAYESVAGQVKTDYVQTLSKQQLKAAADQVLAAIRAGESPADALKPYQVRWQEKTHIDQQDQSIDRWIVDKAFTLGRAALLTEPNKPVLGAFLLPSGDYGIVALNQVKLGDVRSTDKKTTDLAQKTILAFWTRMERTLWREALVRQAKIKLSPIPGTIQQSPDS